MFCSVTVEGSIALLNVIDTVRPLNVVPVIVGEVVSARVNLIGPAAPGPCRLPTRPDYWPGSGSRTCSSRWPWPCRPTG